MRSKWIAIGIALILGCSAESCAHRNRQVNEVPAWAYDAVWYQIFPERFYNGDSTNDPTLASLQGTWPYESQTAWQIMPWTAEWYKLQPWEQTNNRGFYYNAQLRRYGGDLLGIIDKLDYLQDLGVNALYFNPLFESASAHKYGVTFYHHIDNNFGPDPRGDEAIWSQENPADPETWRWTTADKLFLRLIEEAHHRQIKVVIDGVFNHVGIPFWAFQDVLKYDRASNYAGWFIIHSFDDPGTAKNELVYQGWNDIPDLPEIRENKDGPPPDFKAHIAAIVRRWGDPNDDGDASDGVDGWRLDVAEKVTKSFWREFRGWVRDINPEALLIGEIWWEDFPKNKMFNANEWLRGDIFDGVMNYRFADAVLKAFVDVPGLSPSQLNSALGEIRQQYPPHAQFISWNLMNSHDTERLASMVANPNRWLDHACNLQYNPEFNIDRPNRNQIRIQKQILVFQYTYVGTPHIFYGDEVGMWGADDPDCRKPMLWEEFTYEPEQATPFGHRKYSVPVSANLELKNFYKSLINLRRSHLALRRGKYRTVLADDKKRIFVFERLTSDEIIRIVLNLSDKYWNVSAGEYLTSEPHKWRLVLSVNDEEGHRLTPRCARVYLKEK